MIAWQETDLPGRHKGPDKVDPLVGRRGLQAVVQRLVEAGKGLTCTSTAVDEHVLTLVPGIEDLLLVVGQWFDRNHPFIGDRKTTLRLLACFLNHV